MLSFKITRVISLILRILSAIALFTSMVILGINNLELIPYKNGKLGKPYTSHFYDEVGFRYVFATAFIGTAYSIGQGVCTIIHMAKGNQVGHVTFDFYAEEVMSNFLASGAVPGFITAAQYLKMWDEINSGIDHRFINMTYIASGLVIFAFLSSFVISVFSSYALGRNDDDELL
ncbi:CASP-like protein 4D1 [Rosa rugosa]|uniref:CASP-like protein 4D1 n=1 Tax=Rosa rugosa TaxID=74645 RepID=UPI002B40AF76|nr:CASP-like protein 4D1 [Rosa rugosa]